MMAQVGSHGRSAASWGAIIAGAFVATSVSLILFALGAGLGFALVAPWPHQGISAATVTVASAIWLIATQWVAACLGGYIAGRLRTRWIGTHSHEVFFRDTAHGLVTWAVSTALIAMVVATSISSIVGGGVHAAAEMAAAGDRPVGAPGVTTYGIDKLFRSSTDANSGPLESRSEASYIIANATLSGQVAPDDRAYLATLIARKTGAPLAEAQRRVDEFTASTMETQMKLKSAADVARKDAAQAAIFTALSMLIGAFIASVSAALGGRLRDQHV